MWVPVTERLPPLGQDVRVKGTYVAAGTGFPVAYRRECPVWSDRRGWYWESREWRGSVAITHWWDATQKGVEESEQV